MSTDSARPASRASTEGSVAIELYASAVAIARTHFRALAHANTTSLSRLERVAHALASGAANPAFGIASVLASTARDDAARGVQSAMLAVAAARRQQQSPRVLRRLALAALLVDAGRARLAGEASIDLAVFRELPDSLDALAPAASATIGVAGSPALESALITAFEVAWLERPKLGPLYAGALEPRSSTRLLLVVRAYLELIAPAAGEGSLAPLTALERLAARPDLDPAALRALIDAVGMPPAGTVVELSGGEWAVVAQSSSLEPEARKVRLLTNAQGRPESSGPLVALGEAGAREIFRIIEPSEARFNVVRPFYRG